MLCDLRGEQAEALEYRKLAQDLATRWLKEADDGNHYRLAFDKPGTWSQKYNLAWDRVHKGLRFTKPFYDRFTPAISVRDFSFRRVGLDRSLDLLAVLRP